MKNIAYMINNSKKIISLTLALVCTSVFAKENIPNPNISTVVYTKIASGCAPSISKTDLDVNNV
ncbi:MAG: hypothetical protein HN564_05435, partial [Flavobacteriales bacterium]|nr:hypothetical protein [Flavobacteriales bacterium]